MRTLMLLLMSLLLANCASMPADSDALIVKRNSAIPLNNTQAVTRNLYAQFQEWKGTRYKMGGLSKQGIDCSGFVYTTFIERLGYEIPRSTELQANLGQDVNRSQLRPGDLVFFKTSFKARHVGIYVEKGKFLHASSSKGVMISTLDNVYWNKNYWKAVRI